MHVIHFDRTKRKQLFSFFWHALTLLIFLSLVGCSPKSGRSLYSFNCGICHHGGYGQPGEIPPLINRIDKIAATKEGQAYLADVLMWGVSGPMTIGNTTYSTEMPPFRYLKDQEIASLLNWLSAQGKSTPPPYIKADVIAYARAHPHSAGWVFDERKKLFSEHSLP